MPNINIELNYQLVKLGESQTTWNLRISCTICWPGFVELLLNSGNTLEWQGPDVLAAPESWAHALSCDAPKFCPFCYGRNCDRAIPSSMPYNRERLHQALNMR